VWPRGRNFVTSRALNRTGARARSRQVSGGRPGSDGSREAPRRDALGPTADLGRRHHGRPSSGAGPTELIHAVRLSIGRLIRATVGDGRLASARIEFAFDRTARVPRGDVDEPRRARIRARLRRFDERQRRGLRLKRAARGAPAVRRGQKATRGRIGIRRGAVRAGRERRGGVAHAVDRPEGQVAASVRVRIALLTGGGRSDDRIGRDGCVGDVLAERERIDAGERRGGRASQQGRARQDGLASVRHGEGLLLASVNGQDVRIEPTCGERGRVARKLVASSRAASTRPSAQRAKTRSAARSSASVPFGKRAA
jgi:hypothetical protein